MQTVPKSICLGSETISPSVPSPSKVTVFTDSALLVPTEASWALVTPQDTLVSNFLSLFGIIVHVTWDFSFPLKIPNWGSTLKMPWALSGMDHANRTGILLAFWISIFRWLSAPTQVGLKYRFFSVITLGTFPLAAKWSSIALLGESLSTQRSDSLYTLAS